mmetsp:Transcript_28843/g.92303  ORF Transcript_28843/g.92303 Transcript_28843/m.92303 type:complete len:208 (-) Transcript_28843:60-683(-)
MWVRDEQSHHSGQSSTTTSSSFPLARVRRGKDEARELWRVCRREVRRLHPGPVGERRVGAALEQQRGDGGVAAVASEVERTLAVRVDGRDIRAGVKQRGRNLEVAAGARVVQRRRVILVALVCSRAAAQQLGDHLLLPVQAGDVQRRVAVLAALVHADLREEARERVDVARLGGGEDVAHRRVDALVRVVVLAAGDVAVDGRVVRHR